MASSNRGFQKNFERRSWNTSEAFDNAVKNLVSVHQQQIADLQDELVRLSLDPQSPKSSRSDRKSPRRSRERGNINPELLTRAAERASSFDSTEEAGVKSDDASPSNRSERMKLSRDLRANSTLSSLSSLSPLSKRSRMRPENLRTLMSPTMSLSPASSRSPSNAPSRQTSPKISPRRRGSPWKQDSPSLSFVKPVDPEGIALHILPASKELNWPVPHEREGSFGVHRVWGASPGAGKATKSPQAEQVHENDIQAHAHQEEGERSSSDAESDGFSSIYTDMRARENVERWEIVVFHMLEHLQSEVFLLKEVWFNMRFSRRTTISQRSRSPGYNTVRRDRPRRGSGSPWEGFDSLNISSDTLMERRGTCERMILEPHSTPRIFWALMAVLFTFYDLIVLPMQAFDLPKNDTMTLLEWITQIYWTMDIFMSFCTAVYVDNELEWRPGRIAIIYARTWLPIDLVIIIPTWIALLVGGDMAQGKTIKVLYVWSRVMRLARLLRVASSEAMSNVTMLLANSPSTHLCIGVVKTMFAVALLNHVNACIFFAIGNVDGGWASLMEIVNHGSILYQYLASMHWSLGNFQGETQISLGTTLAERAYAVWAIFAALLVLTFFVSSLTNVMMEFRALDIDNTQRHQAILRFLGGYHISKPLSIQVKCYMRWRQRSRRSDNSMLVLEMLPKQLAMDLMHEIRWPLLSRHRFFEVYICEFSQASRRVCADAFQDLAHAPGEVVFGQTEACNRMLFIEAGSLTYYQLPAKTFRGSNAGARISRVSYYERLCSEDSDVRRADIHPGMFMCEAALWTDNWTHRGDLAVVTDAKLAALMTNEFEKAVQEYPACAGMVVEYAGKYVQALNHETEVSDLHFDLTGGGGNSLSADISRTSSMWAAEYISNRKAPVSIADETGAGFGQEFISTVSNSIRQFFGLSKSSESLQQIDAAVHPSA